MCGGSGTTTQQVSIPPEVLARYNSVNAQAQQVAQQPFHIYSTDPSAFVAPINPQQMAGIENINQAANIPAPYFGAATQYLTGAAGAAQPYFDYASQQLTGGTQAGLAGTAAAYNPMAAGAQYAQGLQGGALGQYGAATSMAQPYNYLAGQNIMGAQAGAEPYQQAATTFGLAGATPVMPGQLGSEQINRYMSPYMSNVVEATLAPLRQQQQIEQSTLAGQQVGAGAYGGERGRIAQAVLAQQQNLATAKTAADLLQQGYGQALGTAQQQQQLGLGAEQANRQAIQQAAQQMLGIGQQGFGQGLASSQALSGLGQQVYGQQAGYGQNLAQLAQQGFGQGAAQTAQQAALAQQLYGIGAGTAGQAATLGQGVYGLGANTAQSLAGLGTGAQQAALQGAQAQIGAGTLGQQTQQAGLQALYNQFLQQQGYPFQVAQFLANIAMGTGALSGTTTQTTQPMGFMGSLSDKRAKEDIEPIGKTYDGQDIVKYRYKGQPQKQIGLIAQDVEKHHPEAVGLAGGLKTVDYDRATKDAAEIGKSSEGGKVIPFPDRRGYFDGGAAGGLSPTQIGEILAAQANMYGEYNHPGLGKGSGTTPGLSGYVPGASLPVGQLMSPTAAPELPETTLQDIDAGIGIYKSGKSLFEDEDDKNGSPSKRYGGGLSRHHYAIGGDANAPYGGNDMPYGDEDAKSNVPTSIPGLAGASKMEKPELLKPASPPSSSGSSDLGDLATLAKFAMMFAANGGRINKDDGGGAFLNPAGDFDAEKERNRISELNQYGRLIPDNSVQTAAIERSPVLERFMQGQIKQPSNISAPDTITPSSPGLGGGKQNLSFRTQTPRPVPTPTPRPGLPGDEMFSSVSAEGASARPSRGLAPQLSAPIDVASRPPIRSEETGVGFIDPAEEQRISAIEGMYEPGNIGTLGGITPEQIQPASAGLVPGATVTGQQAPAGSPQTTAGGPQVPAGERDFLTRAGDYLAPKGGFFDLLSQGKEEAIIPVLRGLGAAATSNNRYLLGSLLAGAGAGAAAFQPTKQAQLARERTKAETAKDRAEIMTKLGITPDVRYEYYTVPTPEGFVAFDRINLKPVTRDEIQQQKAAAATYAFGEGNLPPGYQIAPPATVGDKGAATSGIKPISFKTGATPPAPSDIAKEFGQESLIQATAGTPPTETIEGVEVWNQRAADALKYGQELKAATDAAINNFDPVYQQGMMGVLKSGEYFKTADTNRSANFFAGIIGSLLSLPFVRNITPESARQYQEAVDYTTKVSALNAMDQAGAVIAGAPAAALAQSIQAVAKPETSAEARRNIMKETAARFLREKALNDVYSKYRSQIFDVEKFKQKFYADNPLSVFAEQADKMLPQFAGGRLPPESSSSATVKPLTKDTVTNAKDGDVRILGNKKYRYDAATNGWYPI